MQSKKRKDYKTWKKKTSPIRVDIDMAITKTPNWHYYREIGKHFLCDSQRYTHIPGNEHIVHKDEAAKNVREYGEHYTTRPDCFDPWKWMPKTYDLNKKSECLEIY